MAVAHPPTQQVTLVNGKRVTVRPWSMATRRELRPMVFDLLKKVSALPGGMEAASVAPLFKLFMELEDEVVAIVRASIPLDVISNEEWEQDIAWGADVTELAMAIWELNFKRADTGILGKLGTGLVALLGSTLKSGSAKTSQPSSPTPSSTTSLRPVVSPSSQADGEQTQNA